MASLDSRLRVCILLAMTVLTGSTFANIHSSPAARKLPAIVQSMPTTWRPYGPHTQNLTITDYSDYVSMFKAFQAGSVDLTDWPAYAANISAFGSNGDFWLSSPDPQYRAFEVDINNHAQPFGLFPQQTTRPVLAGSVGSSVVGTTSSCAVGLGLATLNVVNLEDGSTIYKDSQNTITLRNLSGSPSATVSDSGGSSPTGTYVFPCLIAGTYAITGTIITGNATSGTPRLACGTAAGCTLAVPGGSGSLGGTVSATWNVVWNSPSTVTPTLGGILFRKALSHLLDKPNFVANDNSISGAACEDIMLAPAHLIQGSPCTSTAGQPGTPLPLSVLNAADACGPGGLAALPGGHFTCPTAPFSLYNLVNDVGTGGLGLSGCSVWWGADGCANGANSGYSGPADIEAACQYLVLASFLITPGGSSCVDVANQSTGTTVLCSTPPCAYPHLNPGSTSSLALYVRTNQQQKHFGTILADSLNFLFGTPNHIGQCLKIPAKGINNCGVGQTMASVVYGTRAGYSIVPFYVTLSAVVPIVFQPLLSLDAWNLYTGDFSLPTTPDPLFSNFHSSFAASFCGGVVSNFPTNYQLYCDPQFDALTSAAEFQQTANPSLAITVPIFSEAAVREALTAMNIPVYSGNSQYVALGGWNFQPSTEASIVSVLGHGFEAGNGFWSLLNMHQVPRYNPCLQPAAPANCSVYMPGGGNPDLIRRGISQDTDNLNPFQAKTPWDLELIGLVFDSMLKPNPRTAGSTLQLIDWMTTSHTSSYNPSELSCIPPPTASAQPCQTGTTTQVWHLRSEPAMNVRDSVVSDLFFHDGTPVTASDVVYSILAYRDTLSSSFYPLVSSVSNVVAVDQYTVQVKLQSDSAFYEQDIGSLPIIPLHLWGARSSAPSSPPLCGDESSVSTLGGLVNAITNGPTSACADPSFDPMQCTSNTFAVPGSVPNCGKTFADGSVQGVFDGSGPWVCRNKATNSLAFGKVGGTCIIGPTGSPSGAAMVISSNLFLSWYERYIRGPTYLQGTSLQAASWADHNKDGQVTIIDLASVNGGSLYWQDPQYGHPGMAEGQVRLVEFYFGHGLTNPFTVSQLVGIDPQIDPYELGNLYYFGTSRGNDSILVNLANLGGSAITGNVTSRVGTSTNTTSFTALAGTRIEVSFQLSSIRLVSVTVVLSTGQRLAMKVPIWPTSPTLGMFQSDWADRDNDGWVTILDASSLASCFDAVPGVGTALCSGAAASYWDNAGRGTVDIVDASALALLFDASLNSWWLPGTPPNVSSFFGSGLPSEKLDPWWRPVCTSFPQPQQNYCLAHT